MTTPRLTHFPATTPRAGVFTLFVIISNSDDDITTLLGRPASPSLDRITALLVLYWILGDGTLIRRWMTDPAFARRPGKVISMPLGKEPAMNRMEKRCVSIQPIALTITTTISSSSPLPSPTVPPPPEHIESIGDDIETLCASLASAMQETMTLRVRVRSLEQHDVVTRESLRIARGRITWSQLRVEYAEQE
ncbi:hypothetical protein Tco_1455693 [Tanacetum coccineum]